MAKDGERNRTARSFRHSDPSRHQPDMSAPQPAASAIEFDIDEKKNPKKRPHIERAVAMTEIDFLKLH
jgi:hypothetical protein